MMGKTLTEAQVRALKALPCEITTWGGRPFGGMPEGVRSTSTLYALYKSGLALMEYGGLRQKWSITDAGILALKEMEKTDASRG